MEERLNTSKSVIKPSEAPQQSSRHFNYSTFSPEAQGAKKQKYSPLLNLQKKTQTATKAIKRMELLNKEESFQVIQQSSQREYEISSISEYDTNEEISPRQQQKLEFGSEVEPEAKVQKKTLPLRIQTVAMERKNSGRKSQPTTQNKQRASNRQAE